MTLTLIGAGMGTTKTLTREAEDALRAADAVIGAPRLLDALRDGIRAEAEKFPEPLPERTAALLAANPRWRQPCVLLSGDPGFHSGAKKLLEALRDSGGRDITVLPGISTPQCLAARLRRPWQNIRLVSAHGADCDILAEVLNAPATLFLAGGKTTPRTIAETLRAAGLGDARLTVAENLSAPGERITASTAQEIAEETTKTPPHENTYAPLAAVLVDNDKTFTRAPGAAGIPDGEFLRGEAPMTKREVRALALSLLALRPESIACDIGAGTGSVSVEMALTARRGRVYAVEKSAAAAALLARNKEKFGTYNMIPVQGEAPAALAALPVPDAVFIGGSAGRLPEILNAVFGKNPNARIVISAITLETLAAATETLRARDARNIEVTQIAAARAVARGNCHMLEAQTPVFLIAAGGKECGAKQ